MKHWLIVLLLMSIGLLNYLDRVLPAVLAEPIKADLVLTDTTLGLINGVGFLLVYAIASIPLAYVADRGRYNLVIVLSLALWSAMTLIGGWVTSGWQLAVSRMGVALGEAGGTPAAHAYITRKVPPEHRTKALSLFTMCLPLGSMAGFVIGGFGGEHLGWRRTFVFMGALGLVLALIAYFTLRRTVGNEAAADSVRTTAPIGQLFRKRTVLVTLLGTSFIGIGGYTALVFTPAFLMRSHSMSLGEAGVTYGIAGGLGAMVGLALVGLAADKLARRDVRWLLGCVILMIAACLPLSFLSFTVESESWAVIGVALNHTIAIAYAAPVFAALHRLAPVDLRARMSALVLLATSILGGLGPVLTGAISDALAPAYGQASLAKAMLIVPIAYLLAMLCFVLALKTFRAELAAD